MVSFPEYKKYCGTPVRLLKSMYGMTLSGKYWYQELNDYLTEIGFSHSTTIPSLFWKTYPDSSVVFLLDYVDDLLYYRTSDMHIKDFEKQLSSRFDLEIIGQAHWYLACWIMQLANNNIVMHQSRYCLSTMKRVLDTADCANNVQ